MFRHVEGALRLAAWLLMSMAILWYPLLIACIIILRSLQRSWDNVEAWNNLPLWEWLNVAVLSINRKKETREPPSYRFHHSKEDRHGGKDLPPWNETHDGSRIPRSKWMMCINQANRIKETIDGVWSEKRASGASGRDRKPWKNENRLFVLRA